jgi:flavin reductase (DIM6/NTAB) family NADH-FMN oxidoreductase RutF
MTVRMDDTDEGRSVGTADVVPVGGQAFRDCIARVPSGVNVVTTDGAIGLGGFTATAVASVSDNPPTVLVCLNRGSHQMRAFRENGVFAVNLLPAGGRAIAEAFAGRTGLTVPERYAIGRWSRLATGAPILEGAVMSLDCRLTEAKDVGTHTVLFGVVVGAVRGETRTDGAPEILIYHDRHYSEV